MKIEIDYDGSTVKCFVDGTSIKRLDNFRVYRVFDTFRIIEKDYYREIAYTQSGANIATANKSYTITAKLNDKT